MNKLFCLFFLVVVFFTWAYSAVTPAEQCSGENFDDLRARIEVMPCGKTRCKLRKGTNTTVNFRFKPKKEVKRLVNQVHANIAGIPLPFIGVDGQSACGHVRDAETGDKISCPLEPEKEYLYTNVFPIERFYPSVSLRVHWALNDGKSNVFCFEVPAVIS